MEVNDVVICIFEEGPVVVELMTRVVSFCLKLRTYHHFAFYCFLNHQHQTILSNCYVPQNLFIHPIFIHSLLSPQQTVLVFFFLFLFVWDTKVVNAIFHMRFYFVSFFANCYLSQSKQINK